MKSRQTGHIMIHLRWPSPWMVALESLLWSHSYFFYDRRCVDSICTETYWQIHLLPNEFNPKHVQLHVKNHCHCVRTILPYSLCNQCTHAWLNNSSFQQLCRSLSECIWLFGSITLLHIVDKFKSVKPDPVYNMTCFVITCFKLALKQRTSYMWNSWFMCDSFQSGW